MKRAELIESLLEILAKGPAEARVLVVVSLPPDRYSHDGFPLVGAFGEVDEAAEAVGLLVRVAGMVERKGAMVDSREAIRATLRLRESETSKKNDDSHLPE